MGTWAWLGNPSFFLSFFHMFFQVVCYFSLRFLITCLMICYVLGVPFSSIKFLMFFHRFWNGFWSHFWCFFDTFTVGTCNLLNHPKHLFLQWISMILPSRETWFLMFFMICSLQVLALIVDAFWHRFCFHFGTPLASNSMFWGDLLLMIFWIVFQSSLIENGS